MTEILEPTTNQRVLAESLAIKFKDNIVRNKHDSLTFSSSERTRMTLRSFEAAGCRYVRRSWPELSMIWQSATLLKALRRRGGESFSPQLIQAYPLVWDRQSWTYERTPPSSLDCIRCAGASRRQQWANFRLKTAVSSHANNTSYLKVARTCNLATKEVVWRSSCGWRCSVRTIWGISARRFSRYGSG